MKGRIYEIFENGSHIGTVTSAEAAKLIETPIRNIYQAASSGCMLKRRYSIYPVSAERIEKVFPKELCEEWDRTRLLILRGGNGRDDSKRIS